MVPNWPPLPPLIAEYSLLASMLYWGTEALMRGSFAMVFTDCLSSSIPAGRWKNLGCRSASSPGDSWCIGRNSEL